MQKIKFVILGEPRPKQSFKFTKSGIRYKDAKVKQVELTTQALIINQLPENFQLLTGALGARCVYEFPIPKSFTKKKIAQIENGEEIYKSTKPDVDSNLNKAYFDAMQSLIFDNDSQIAEIYAKKIYSKQPKCTFEIWELEKRELKDIKITKISHTIKRGGAEIPKGEQIYQNDENLF